MVSVPLFSRPWDRRAPRSRPSGGGRGRLAPEVVEELAIGGDQGAGPAHDESNLVVAVALVDEECHTCERVDIVLNGTKGMIEAACDLVGLQPLKVEADCLDSMRLAGANILLLATAGDLNAALPEGVDIANDGPDTAIEQAEREVLVTE
jgi:hypothetical protein